MAAHWYRALKRSGGPAMHRRGGHASRAKLAVNCLGAVATGIVLAVILAAKFVEGAWLTVVVIPGTIVLLRAVRRYYDEIDRQLLHGSHRSIDLRRHEPPVVLVPIKQWDRLARKALEYALRLSTDVIALHVTRLEGPDAQDHEGRLRKEWHEFVLRPAARAGVKPPQLQLVSTEFRSMTGPLLRAVQDADRRFPGRPVAVILPELVEGRWWGYLMHAKRERRLRARLLRCGRQNVVVSSVPWQLRPANAEQVIAEEEPDSGRRNRIGGMPGT